MKKPVYLYAKNGLVTLKIGRWPFRYTVRWNLHDGQDAANLAAFVNGLRTAASKGTRSGGRKK